jgi:pyruvate/2-oxoglutarate dehydrogenase complex dihydrolipoamide dehydrogenase (E3) component
MRHAGRWGLEPVEPQVDLARVGARIRAIQDEIAATDDSPERLRAEGIDLIEGPAVLGPEPHVVRAGGRTLRTRFALVCTGSRPAVPEIPGLAECGHLTAETLWEQEPPASLLVLGGGAAGCELGQALTRLGVPCTILEQAPRLLPGAEPEHAELLAGVLAEEGVTVVTGARVSSVARRGGRVVATGTGADGAPAEWAAEGLLVTTGRAPNVEGLGLEALGIRSGAHGIPAGPAGQTAAPWVYAAGDVAGGASTHAAAAQAARALRAMFFPGSPRAPLVTPACLFTDPELARVGLTEAQARARHGDRAVRVRRRELARVDRARTASRTTGSVLVVTARGRVVGASILAPAASEVITELTHAVEHRRPLRELADTIHPYPAIATAVQQVAGEAALDAVRPFARLARLGGRIRRT